MYKTSCEVARFVYQIHGMVSDSDIAWLDNSIAT